MLPFYCTYDDTVSRLLQLILLGDKIYGKVLNYICAERLQEKKRWNRWQQWSYTQSLWAL